MKIEIEVIGKGKAEGVLDNRNPTTAQQIFNNLPFEGEANIWLEEVYFDAPFKEEYENPSTSTSKGDISYWPPGPAFCIFHGQSQPASAVNNIGKIISNLELFKEVENDDKIIIRKLED
jgi:hypothetical protein